MFVAIVTVFLFLDHFSGVLDLRVGLHLQLRIDHQMSQLVSLRLHQLGRGSQTQSRSVPFWPLLELLARHINLPVHYSLNRSLLVLLPQHLNHFPIGKKFLPRSYPPTRFSHFRRFASLFDLDSSDPIWAAIKISKISYSFEQSGGQRLYRLFAEMRKMLLGLFLEVYQIFNSQCYTDDGHQWIGLLHLGPPRFLPGYEVSRRVRHYTRSWTYFDVFWEVVGFCAGDSPGLWSCGRAIGILGGYLLAFDSGCGNF